VTALPGASRSARSKLHGRAVRRPIDSRAQGVIFRAAGYAVRFGELEAALQAHVKARLAAYQYPRLVEFMDELPMTSSGKVDRRELRRRAEHAD